jgi:Uma2 family endonuclease
VKANRHGYFAPDGMRLSHPEVGLSTEPDGMFVAYETLQRGRVQLVEGAEHGFTELIGGPDMVLELLSDKSVKKDTEDLRRLYWEAGVVEYWLVDARGEKTKFEIFKRGARGFVATRKQGGWLTSTVLGRSFRLTRQTDPLGHPEYQLDVRE